MTDKIADYPKDISQHEFCDKCGDDNVSIVITAGSKEIVLCSKHTGQLIREIYNIFGNEFSSRNNG